MGEAGDGLGEEVGSRGRGSDTEKSPPPVRFREAAPGAEMAAEGAGEVSEPSAMEVEGSVPVW